MQTQTLRKINANVKTLANASLSAVVALLLFASATVYAQSPVKSDAQHVSFDGYLQGTETDVPEGSPPTFLSVTGSIPGLATYLTEFTLNYKAKVNIQTGSAVGVGELVAANGDRLYLSIVGQGEPTDASTPNLSSIVEIDSIIGGTGQFAGATGWLTVRRLIDLTTGFTSGTVHGTVLLGKPQKN